MNQQEGIKAERVSRLCPGYTMVEIKSFGNINKSTVYDGKKMFDEFMSNWCSRMHLDSWKSPLDLLAGWHPCLRKQEDAGLAQGGLAVSCGGSG
jgi:hypothetical protein